MHKQIFFSFKILALGAVLAGGEVAAEVAVKLESRREARSQYVSPGPTATDPVNGDVWLAVTTAEAGGEKGEFWVWRYDRQGNVRQQILIGKAPDEAVIGVSASAISCLEILSDGTLVAVARVYGDAHAILGFTSDGDKVFEHPLDSPRDDAEFYDLAVGENDDLFLAGRRGRDAVIRRMTADGAPVYEKRFDREGYEMFTGLDWVAGGERLALTGLVMSGSRGVEPWLVQVGLDGQLIREERLAPVDPVLSSLPQVVSLRGGQIFMTWMDGTSCRAQFFTPEFKRLWGGQLGDFNHKSVLSPSLTPYGDDLVLSVTDAVTNQQKLVWVDPDGRVVSEGEFSNPAVGQSIVALSDNTLMVFTRSYGGADVSDHWEVCCTVVSFQK